MFAKQLQRCQLKGQDKAMWGNMEKQHAAPTMCHGMVERGPGAWCRKGTRVPVTVVGPRTTPTGVGTPVLVRRITKKWRPLVFLHLLNEYRKHFHLTLDDGCVLEVDDFTLVLKSMLIMHVICF